MTVDSPVLGPRYRETRTPFALPPGAERANLRGLKTATGSCGSAPLASPGSIGKRAAGLLNLVDDPALQNAPWK